MTQKSITAYDADSPDEKLSSKTCQYNEVTECPSCHFAIEPKPLSAFIVKKDAPISEDVSMYLTCLCKRCRNVFLSKFKDPHESFSSRVLTFQDPAYSVPYKNKPQQFNDAIRVLSPGFVETYTQAETAEALHLYEICGSGYRKALEYLVKDYLCVNEPENTELIQSEFLSASIKRINYGRIQTLAEKCAWIGNDETHYVRKHDDLNFTDMKKFIKAILYYIESELAFKDAESITGR